MTFRQEMTEEFIRVYRTKQPFISNFEGCHGVELLRCKEPDNIFFTYSIWDDEEALQKYRGSELFKETWAQVKPMFEVRAEAWSVEEEV